VTAAALTGSVLFAVLQGVAPTPAADSVAPVPDGPYVVQVEQGGTPMVGFASVLPVGAANDPEGRAGTAWLHARLLEASLHRTTRFSAATVDVEVGRFSTDVTVLTPRSSAPRDLRDFYRLIRGDTPSTQEEFERARSELIAQLAFESGAPVRQFEEARAELVYDGAWGGAIHGTSEALAALTWTEFQAWVSGIPRTDLLIVRVGAADSTLRLPGPPPPPGRGLSSTGRSDSGGDQTLPWAWAEGRSERLVRPITNSWVTVDAPIRDDLDATALGVLVQHLEELLSPDPPDPGIFSAEVEVLRSPRGPILSVTATVAPEVADRWARRLERAVNLEDLSSWIEGGQFDWQRRRFRNNWLRREARPEAKALRIARDLLSGAEPRDPLSETRRLRAEDVERLVEAVGPARILVYGPDLQASGGGASR